MPSRKYCKWGAQSDKAVGGAELTLAIELSFTQTDIRSTPGTIVHRYEFYTRDISFKMWGGLYFNPLIPISYFL